MSVIHSVSNLPPGGYPYFPGFAIRFTSLAAYLATQSLWIDPGIPIIVGMSPNDVVALTGLSIVRDGTYAQLMAVPNIPIESQAALIGSPSQIAPFDQGSGTINGKAWSWQCSVELYLGNVLPAVPSLSIRTGTYVGTAGALNVTTGFDMTGANSLVIVKPISGTLGGGGYFQTGMPGTACAGSSSLRSNAITGFTSTGFSVGIGDGSGNIVDQNGVTYGYIAISNPDGTYFRVGSYTGNGLARTIAIATGWSPTHVWTIRAMHYYASTDFPAGNSVPLNFISTGLPITNEITGFASNGFTLGTGTNTNNNGGTYYYSAFKADAFVRGSMMNSGVITGDGTQTQATPSVTFTPGFGITQWIQTTAGNGWWRVRGGQTLTRSDGWGPNPGTSEQNIAQGGINALNANNLTLGATIAPVGVLAAWQTFAGYAASGSGGGGNCSSSPGTIGIPYESYLKASGGTPPYTFSLTAGGLPNGLILDPVSGKISGVPTSAGTFVFTFIARDNVLTTVGTTTCSITINTAGLSPVPSLPAAGTSPGVGGCIEVFGP